MKKKILTMILAASIITGYVPNKVNAIDFNGQREISLVREANYQNGVYNVKNRVLKIDKDEESTARKYVEEESVITITNEGILVAIELNKKDIMSNTKIKVNGNEVSHSETDKGDLGKVLQFNLDSLTDNIEVETIINLGFMNMKVAFRVTLDTKDIPLDKEEECKEGLYTIENDALQIDNDKESVARKYLHNISDVEFKGDKTYLTLRFTGKSMMANHKVTVNGGEKAFQVVNNEGDNLYIKFEISSLKDDVVVGTTVLGAMNVKFRVVLNEETLQKVEGEIPPVNPTPTPDQNPIPPTTNPSPDINPEVKPEKTPSAVDTENYNSYKIYSVENEIITDSQIGYGAARSALAKTSYLEVIDGANYITLGFSQMNVMSNIRVDVDGQNIQYEVIRKTASTMDIRFKVKDISSSVTVSAYINMIERDISFGVDFLENTLTIISESEKEKPLATGGTTLNISNDEEKSEDKKEEKVSEEIEAKEYFKKYTIENDILSDSTMGRTMARKYLDKISILEEIDGKLYLTIKFSGTDAMDNFRITVNGEDVEHSIVASDDEAGIKAFRFPIKDINDKIQVYIFIKPVKMNIDFGVDLLEETKILIEEGTIKDKEKSDQTLLTNFSAQEVKEVSVMKVVLVTIVVTLLLEGIIYSIIRRRKKNKAKAE